MDARREARTDAKSCVPTNATAHSINKVIRLRGANAFKFHETDDPQEM